METMNLVATIIAVISVLCLLYFFWNGEILRENGPASKYSFSRFQLACWTIVIAPLFCLHWGYTSPQNPDINETALVLLGIAAATAVTSSIVKSALASKPRFPDPPPLKTTTPTVNFWNDILSDDSGNLSLVRLQNLIFTFIYIVIYISIFFNTGKKFPVFDNQAYTLMGISSGTYLFGRAMYK